MKLLAIETATAVTAIALYVDGSVHEHDVDDARRHTEVLAPAIETLLAQHDLHPSDLDGIVVDVGPGLFTGLRVGVATAKGLSIATGVGLFSVTSTDALAAAALDAGVTGAVVTVVDARRQEVFWASFDCSGDGVVARGEVTLATPSALASHLSKNREPSTLVGDGAVRHRSVLDVPTVEVRDDLVVPSPGAASRLVAHRVALGVAPVGHADVHPWYLREADAVANFSVREAGA